MPFFDTRDRSKKLTIDLNRYQPIMVYSHCDIDGKIRPLKFKYTIKDESIETLNIDSVQYAKDFDGGVSFSCLTTSYGRQIQVTIVHIYMDHLWFIEK